jgi:hypothetical protein
MLCRRQKLILTLHEIQTRDLACLETVLIILRLRNTFFRPCEGNSAICNFYEKQMQLSKFKMKYVPLSSKEKDKTQWCHYINTAKRMPVKMFKYFGTILREKYFNPLNTKRRPLYLKTQFVPRSKHFSSLL